MDDFLLFIFMQARGERCVGIHEHPCPECYERFICDMECSRERDLEVRGMQSGAYWVCEKCQANDVESKKD